MDSLVEFRSTDAQLADSHCQTCRVDWRVSGKGDTVEKQDGNGDGNEKREKVVPSTVECHGLEWEWEYTPIRLSKNCHPM